MTAVLDSSALLAILLSEQGSDAALPYCRGSLISAVNLAEVHIKTRPAGIDAAETERSIQRLEITAVPFDATLAIATAAIHARTRGEGLSLGDCACLALGETTGWTIVTADTKWAQIPCRVPIVQIR